MKKKLGLFLTILMVLQLLTFQQFVVHADEQEAPKDYAINYDEDRLSINYAVGKGAYVNLSWIPPTTWSNEEDVDVDYQEVYLCEFGKTYEKYGETLNSTTSQVEISELKTGTIYHTYVSAVHQDVYALNRDYAISNGITFLTDTAIRLSPGEDNTLQIEWDKVDYYANSVSYDVYISESASFAETSPIRVEPDDIGTIVKVVGDKLVYNVLDLKPGTIYYVKIATIINDDRVICLPASKIAEGYTKMTVGVSKISSDWWKIQWNAITNTNLGGDEEELYKIIRSVGGDLEKEIAATKDLNLLVKVPTDNTYFIIKCDMITQLGNPITVLSDPVYVEEGEVVANPTVPEILVDANEQHTIVGSDNITLLWEAPYTPEGEIDTDVTYDIWILDDPTDIDKNGIVPDLEDFEITEENYVYENIGSLEGDRVIGYKHKFENLLPNSTYYIKIIAKKSYIIDDETVNTVSEPGLKAFTTLPDGAIDQPVTPYTPPFSVKKQVFNSRLEEVTTHNSITVQWKNKWYEVWNNTESRWDFLADDDVDDVAVTGDVYRLINYDDNVKFSVGYEVYTSDYDFSRLKETLALMPMQITNIPNSETNDTIEQEITGLLSNTPYVIWMRAYRNDSLKSKLSDPIVVSTRPYHEIPLNTPTVPIINYDYSGDTYVEIGWNVLPNNYYNIKYGEEEDITKACTPIALTPNDMKSKTKYKIESLVPDTVYYFWIQSKIVGSGDTMAESAWSDGYMIETLPYQPPDAPTGFGIKNATDAVRTDYITFEWFSVDGLDYILEVATNPNFTDVITYSAGKESNYKVEGLTSNTRYYARLCAYDSVKKLNSAYTQTITAKTLKNNEEYDSGFDTEVEGPGIPKPMFDENDDDIAVIDITDELTDVFIQELLNNDDAKYVVNFEGLNPDESANTDRPEGVEHSKTRISPRILNVLNSKKISLVLNNGPVAVILTPEIANSKTLKQVCSANPDGIIEIEIQKATDSINKANELTYISDIWQLSFICESSSGKININGLSGFSIKIPYYDSKWFDKKTMSGMIYDNKALEWVVVPTTSYFNNIEDEGYVLSNISGSGNFAIIKSTLAERFSDVSSGSDEAIKAIISNYDLKSLGTGLFEPLKMVTKAEMVKVLFDIMGYNYGEDYLTFANKSGITVGIDTTDMTINATREQAAAMISRAYELMTGTKIGVYSIQDYADGNSVNTALASKVGFAASNKILDITGNYIRPKESFTRDDMMQMIYNMLERAGVN